MRSLLFFVLLCPFLGFSQSSYKEERIIFSENVVSEAVLGTFKKDGFLYIATHKGLYLYDGYIFISAKNVSNKIHYFYNDIDHIYLEENGLGLISIKDIFSERKILQKVVYTDANQDNDHFENIYKDIYGNIWSSDFHHIKYLSSENKTHNFVVDRNNKHLNINVNYLPLENRLLITSEFGIYVWDKKKEKLLTKINKAKITSSTLYDGKIIVVDSLGKIYTLSLINKRLTTLSFDATQLRFVQNITDGTPLIAYNDDSVFEMDFKNLSKRTIYTSENKINHIFYDQKYGIYWISTQNGLVKLVREKEIIKKVQLPFKGTVTSIIETKTGIFWFSDNHGNIVQKSEDALKIYTIPEKTYQLTYSENTILVGTENGVYSINIDDKSPFFRKIIKSSQKIKKAIIHNGKIWTLPEYGRIQVYDAKTLQEIPNYIKNSNSGHFENAIYNDIIENEGKVWIASWLPKDYGISFFDEDAQLLTQISTPNKQNPQFVGDFYNRVNKLSNGSLIFSAFGGWNIISKQGKIVKSVFVNSYGNVADDNIQGMAEDYMGNIWFGCAEGLYRYNKKSANTIRVSRKDGLTSNSLIFGFLMGRNHKLYFSTEKEVQTIDLNILQNIKLFDDLKITGIKINNDFISNIPKQIEIDEAKAQQIEIYFSVLNYWAKDKIKYRYHFDDHRWIDLGNNPKLSLLKLRNGNYNITIEAFDELDGSHRKQINLHLKIVPPFYKTWWLITLIILSICTIVWSISHYLIRKEKQTGILMKKVKENENKMLRSQMNPHFLFNSLNSINSFIIQSKREEASGYLTSFSKLMRKILDNSRKDTVPLIEELETAKLYLDLEAVRLEHKFDYSFTIDKNINKEDVFIPALILQPFLENSVWHGINPMSEKGFIDIKIMTNNDDKKTYLNIEIEDNGIGRNLAAKSKKETLHKSHGLDITLERLRMNNPQNSVEIIDLYNYNSEAVGTLVKLKIYYSHD